MSAVRSEGYVTDVSYIPGFYANLAPVALRQAAVLNRIVPPTTARGFRYLELGCGLGRALTTLAAANPQGQFVGVDVNPEHTAVATREAAAAGLDNVRLVTADFGHLPDDIGRFDFIALHGVYSWVAPQVREEILAIARARLAPGGLLLVSYNAMPGWAHLQPIRGILRQYAALRQGDSIQRVRDALAYLVFIRDRHAKYFDDNPNAASYVDQMLKQDIRYLVHEYLNEHWTSFYFAEVAAAFNGVGLGFVGSLPLHTNFWDLCVRPEFQELFRTTTNRLVTEAHKDFCANTAFRWDIYAAAPRMMQGIDDRLREADDLHYRASRPGITLPYQANLGVVTTTVQGPVYERLLAMLGGRSLPMSAILTDAQLGNLGRDDLARAVDAGVAMGMFEVTSGELPPRPEAVDGGVTIPSAFNRAIVAEESLSGRPLALASTLTGTGHAMGDFDAAILDEIVQRGRDGLTTRVDARLAASGRMLQKDGNPVSDESQRRQLVDGACTAFLGTALPELLRLGIVAAG